MRRRPFPVVVAAPSGAGKTSLAHALVDRNDDIVFSISATTRAARPHERAGRDYYFVDEAEFDRMLEAGQFLEWATVHGKRYGTPRKGVEEALARGHIVVLDIDVQGARQVRKAFPDAILIFVLPPSGEELGRRLIYRGSEGLAERRRRLEAARQELAAAGEFDYVVVNENLESAVRTLEAIVTSERQLVRRAVDLQQFLGRMDAALVKILERSE